ncbi:MAG: hypothetical protein LBE98_01635 [Puniceicoccales bacterium]|jgi:hypothetical protein|nr:hypothetical protein [Puniceicoccales bacterium]
METFTKLSVESATYELDQYEMPIFHMVINKHDAYVPVDRFNFYHEYHVVPLTSFSESWNWNSVLPKIHVNTIGDISGGHVEIDVSGCTDDEKICALTEKFFEDSCLETYKPKIININ